MKQKLGEELKWYTLYASEEEYDEKAVESILYLLDRWEPLEEGTVPPVEESWKRFLKVAGRKELLPVEDAAVCPGQPEEMAAGQKQTAVRGKGTAVKQKQTAVSGESVAVKQMAVSGESVVLEQKQMAVCGKAAELEQKQIAVWGEAAELEQKQMAVSGEAAELEQRQMAVSGEAAELEQKLVMESMCMGKKSVLAEEAAETGKQRGWQQSAACRFSSGQELLEGEKLTLVQGGTEAEFSAAKGAEAREGLILVKEAKGSLAMANTVEGGKASVKEPGYGLASEEGTKEAMVVEQVKDMPQEQEEGAKNAGLDEIGNTGVNGAKSADLGGSKRMGLDGTKSADLDGSKRMGLDGAKSADVDGSESTGVDGTKSTSLDGTGNTGLDTTERHAVRKKVGRLARFAVRHKMIAAAVLVLMVLMVGNTIHAVANPETGFFFWMEKDDSGVKMMTSPEGLDGKTNSNISIYYKQEDVPEWAKEWTQLETGIEFETQDAYDFQYFEISESDNRQHVTSYFLCEDSEKDIVVGVWIYWDKVSYFREEFLNYDYVQTYEFAQKEMDIYKKTEDAEQIFYIVCFYDENCKYYVKGWENLDEIKKVAEDYWGCVKNNSKEN